MRDSLKDIFQFSRREQSAIIILLALILAMIIVSIFSNHLFSTRQYEVLLADSLSIKAIPSKNRNEEISESYPEKTFNSLQPEKSAAEILLTPFPFNPNKLPDSEWKRMGMSERQIRMIKNYEAKGGKFYKKEDFAKMYCISKEEYAVLEPFINIPPIDSLSSGQHSKEKKRIAESAVISENEPVITPLLINQTDSLELIKIPNLSPWLAHRILKYRNSLGGFVALEQLFEVSGIDSLKFKQISTFLVIDPEQIKKLNINRLTFKELLQHPYLDYDQTKKIINYRERRGFIRTDDELRTIVGFTSSELETLKPYLNYN